MEEVKWVDISNYEGIYQASDTGFIRTHPNKTTYTKLHGVRKWKTRILKGRGDHKITGKRVSLWKDGHYKEFLVARLIALTFLGPPPHSDFTVNHKDGNRLNNNINNLEWLSLADNIKHAFNTGLMPYKKVCLYNENTNITFNSMNNASLFLKRNKGYISLCLKKKRKIRDSNNVIYCCKIF